MMNRTIFIGDIHGCLDELNRLLEKISYNPDSDIIYSVGDFVNRGPDSRGVFLKLKEIGCRLVLGNHEYYIKQHIQKNNKKVIEHCQKIFTNIYDDFVSYIFQIPLYIETDDFILVHAGIDPRKKLLSNQNAKILTSVRTLNPLTGKIDQPDGQPWFENYTGSKLIVFGHWAQLEGVIKPNVIGLDTGCVYGKKLSALIYPEKKIISVEAKRIYEPIQ
jgi:diadenosine tetraphosphatase ApaH/serine/threonine PP2A family protein phosphatase